MISPILSKDTNPLKTLCMFIFLFQNSFWTDWFNRHPALSGLVPEAPTLGQCSTVCWAYVLPHRGAEPLEQSRAEYIIAIALKTWRSNTPVHLPGCMLSWEMVIKWLLSIGVAAPGSWYGAAPVNKMARSLMRGSVCGWKAWMDCSTWGSELRLSNGLLSPLRPSLTQEAVKMMCWVYVKQFYLVFTLSLKYNSPEKANKYYSLTLIMTDASGTLQKKYTYFTYC